MEMTKKIGLPDKGEEIKLITTKGINAAYLMLNILDQKGPAEEIYLAMFRINVQGVEILETLMAEKKTKRIYFVLSTLMLSQKDYHCVSLLKVLSRQYNIDVRFCVTHTKIVAIKYPNDFYVIEGSGSLTENARVEQYSLCNDLAVYNFHSDWMENIKSLVAGTKRLDEV